MLESGVVPLGRGEGGCDQWRFAYCDFCPHTNRLYTLRHHDNQLSYHVTPPTSPAEDHQTLVDYLRLDFSLSSLYQQLGLHVLASTSMCCRGLKAQLCSHVYHNSARGKLVFLSSHQVVSE